MSMKSKPFVAVFGCALILVAAAAARAAVQQALPSFALIARDGSAIKSSGIARPRHWVLIVLQPRCGSCDAVLRAVAHQRPALPADSFVVVASGTPASALAAVLAAHPALRSAAWYADPGGRMPNALRLSLGSAVVGMDGEAIAWTVNGVVTAPGVTRTITAWLQQ